MLLGDQLTAQNIKGHVGAGMANVWLSLRGRAAQVNGNMPLAERLKALQLASCGIEDLKSYGPEHSGEIDTDEKEETASARGQCMRANC